VTDEELAPHWEAYYEFVKWCVDEQLIPASRLKDLQEIPDERTDQA
jgi:hypothetical protein